MILSVRGIHDLSEARQPTAGGKGIMKKGTAHLETRLAAAKNLHEMVISASH